MKPNAPRSRSSFPRQTTFLLSAIFLSLLLITAADAQQNGVWTNDASSVWSAGSNWLNGVIADGVGATADFTLDNANVDTVTMDASHGLGTLLFGNNATIRTNQWIVNASGVIVLTLAGGTPTIAVSNGISTNTAVLTLPIAGSAGLTKVGSGKLVIGSTNNSYAGGTTVSGGVLQLTNSSGPGNGPVLYLSFNNVNGSIVTNGGSGGAAMNGVIVGGGISVTAGAGPNGVAALTVGSGLVNSGYVLVNSSVVPLTISNNAWTVAMWINTTSNGAVYAYQGDGGWSSGNTTFHLNAGTNDQAGPYAGGVRNSQGWETGSTSLTNGNWHFVVMTCVNGVKTNYVDGNIDSWLVIGGSAMMNQWTGSGTGGQFWIGGSGDAGDGNVRLNGEIAEVYVYNRAISLAEVQALTNAVGPSSPAPSSLPTSAVSVAAGAKLDLNGNNSAATGLTGAGTVDTTLSNGLPTLTIDNSSNPTFTGVITNSTGTMNVVVVGSGALTLNGLSGYTGNTWFNSTGTLDVNSANALGLGTSGKIVIGGGTIDNTSGATVTLAANKPQSWLNDFTFGGSTNLNLGTGAVTLSGSGSTRTVTLNSNILTVGAIGTAVPNTGLTLAGVGTLITSGGSVSQTGDLVMGTGATIADSQDYHSTGLTGTGTVQLNGNVNKWFYVTNFGNTKVFSGTIQSSPLTPPTSPGLGFSKSGTGTQILNGSVTLNDRVTVSGGKLFLTGSGICITNPNNSGSVPSIGNANASSGVLILSNNATFLANYAPASVSSSSFSIANAGSTLTAAGSVQMYPGCTLNVGRQLTVEGGSSSCGFGAFSQFGGTTTVGGFIACGGNTNGGVFNMSGGTLLMNGSSETLGYGNATVGSYGVQNIFGTAVFATTGAGNGVWPGELNNGTVNVWGNGTMAITNDGVWFAHGAAAANFNGTFNLDGGTLLANFIGSATLPGTFNFNGGVLRANAAGQNGSGLFTPGASSTTFNDYSGGTIIDDGGFAITFAYPINAPSGSGVSSIPITSGGSNYIDSPIVLISGGSGSGAKASSQIDYNAGTVTNIVITCPGTGYNNADTLTFTIIGGGGSGLVLGAPTFALNTPGSLTKMGSGSLTLASGNGFAGTSEVLAGNLTVNPNTFSSAPGLLVTNGSLTLDVSSANQVNANSATLQNNSTLAVSFGNLTANPTFPALNTTTFSAPGTGLTIAVSGLGLRPGTITLVKYTGSALANLNNFSLTLPPGVAATLVNNTGNDSIDLNITTAPNFLTWEGVAGTAWDVNTTANWRDPLNNEIVYQQYTNGAVIVGDAVTFDDTLTNDFVDPQPTNINLTTTLYSFPVTVNSTLPYSFGGAGSLAGTGYILKTNTGTLTIGTSNSFSGGTFIGGGTLIISNDSALGAASGVVNFGGGTLQANSNITNARPISVTAASSFDVLTNVTVQLGGVSSGTGTLTKLDTGTLVLTGTMSNTPAIAGGTVQVAGTGRISSSGVFDVGNAVSASGVLTISGGTVQANAATGGQFSSSLIAGSIAASAGDLQMSSGTLTTAQQLGLGAGLGGYAAFTLSGGTVTLGSYLVVGFNNDTAVINQSGGAITVTTNCPTIAAGGTGSIAVANISGGTLTAIDNTNGNASGRGGMFIGENGTGFLNVSGSASLTLVGDANVTIGRQAGSFGELNLLGGTITTPQVSKGIGTAIFNFNGGTLKAFTNSSSFMGGLSSATIYSGGAKIIDGGFIVSMSQPLASPTGFGVSSITVGSGGAGYIDTPVVTISGGSGSNATATATVSGGAVTAINVTCPGTGYISGDAVSVNFIGGGGTGATAGTATLAANVAGGLTKTGTGTLTLGGANTYSGATTVGAGGQLIVTPAHQVSGAVTITNGGTFGVLVNSGGAATIGSLNLGTTSPSTNFLAFTLNTGTNPTAPVLQCGTLTLTGTNWVRMNGIVSPGVFPVLKYSGAIAGTGILITNTVLGPQGLVAAVSNDVADSILFVNVTSGSSGIVWQGTNSAAGSTNVWGLNSITNWLLGSTPTTYQQTVPPGDAVTFNDSGSGIVLLSNSVSPATVTISNNAVNYTFAGTGNMAGTAGLTKLGTGSATIGFTNDAYAGNTVISNGTLQTGSTTAIPSGGAAGNVVIASGGALDINGLSSTINGLSGAGTVNNSSGTAATLTFGAASTGDTTWAGSFTNSGTGGIAFLKTGTNTVTITGTNFMGGTDPQNQMNGGTMILTNGGSFIMPSGEFWIAQNAVTGAVVVAGGSIICSNNYIVVGRNNAAANGTMTVNSGTVQKGGATGQVVVGSLNATGTLIVNGGQVLNTGDLWLGESASAHGYLYLNGGLVQARVLRPNGTAPTASIAYFNGGILQATVSTNSFLQVQSMVMSNGLILDDNGFTLAIGAAALQDGDGLGGGLLKKGSGTVYLDAVNTYTGTTAVSNGVLAGVGTISGPVLVNSSGTIGAGDAGVVGTLNLNSTPLTIQGSAMLRINKTGGTLTNDVITTISTANYGGTLIISNITSDATPLANGDTFPLFNAGASSGNFANIIGSPGPGLAYSFNPANGVLSVVTGIVQPPAPTINKITLSGTNVIITATNNNGPGGTWALLGTNNLASPLTNWPVISTGTFDSNGNVALTNGIGTNRGFFILRAP